MEKRDLRITNVICTAPYAKGVSDRAKLLYVTLCEIEARFCTKDKDWFFYSDDELAGLRGESVTTVKKYKKELVNVGLITTFRNSTGKTGYRLLKCSKGGFYMERRKQNGQ